MRVEKGREGGEGDLGQPVPGTKGDGGRACFYQVDSQAASTIRPTTHKQHDKQRRKGNVHTNLVARVRVAGMGGTNATALEASKAPTVRDRRMALLWIGGGREQERGGQGLDYEKGLEKGKA